MPCLAASMAISAWRLLGGDELPPVGLDPLVSPAVGEGFCLLWVAGGDSLQHGQVFQVEEILDAVVAVGVGAAHEAVADHADAEGFCHGVVTSWKAGERRNEKDSVNLERFVAGPAEVSSRRPRNPRGLCSSSFRRSRRSASGVALSPDGAEEAADGGEYGVRHAQPWASRTAIMVLRMVFQVEGFSSVEFGNMQPSQQMCWMPRLAAPSSQ